MGQEEDEDYQQRFGGIGRLYGVAALKRFRGAHVAVVGVGGVGCWAAEALARSGVGRITLIDMDEVCINNTNRQSHALDGQVGRPKVEALGDRLRLINPHLELREVMDFLTPSTVDVLLDADYDVVIDAIDDLYNKALLIASCRERGQHVLTSGGAGGRRDPAQLAVVDLAQSGQDGLLRRLRKRLREEHGFASGKEAWGIPCVASKERAIYPTPEGGVCHTAPEGEALRLDCASGFGASLAVTGTVGFMLASLALDELSRGM
jgi:tRNA threonylcarbamoyladenosine dehydratase